MKLGIGTAQFGLNYGISNQQGKTSPEEVAKILELAHKSGVRLIDTAHLYGTSEEVLGQTINPEHNFAIVTKTPQFSQENITINDTDLLENTLHQSLENLQQSSIYALLIHRADDILTTNGHLLIEKMQSLKKQGLIKKIGVSVYNSQQIDKIIANYAIDILQLPINVLDQRLIKSGHLSKLKHLGVEIHARSIFLQGLLLMNFNTLSVFFEPIKDHLSYYHHDIANLGLSSLQVSLAFVLGLKEVDYAIVGANNCHHIQEILNATNINQIQFKDFDKYFFDNELILNPTNWYKGV